MHAPAQPRPVQRADDLSGSGTRAFERAAQLFGLLTVAFVVCVSFSIGAEWFSNAVDDIGELVAALIAAGACAVASRRARNARVGWVFMGWSSFSWACGEAIWSYYDLIRGVELPSPSAADLGFLAAVPLAVVGLRKLFSCPPRRRTQLVDVLGGVLLGIAVLVVVWALTLLRDPQANELLQNLVGLAYPLGDLIMAAVVLAAVARGTGDPTRMYLVLAGIVAFTVADTWFAVVVTIGDFGLPYWLDTGWVLSYFLVALGALWASLDAGRAPTRTSNAAPSWSDVSHAAGAVTGAPSHRRDRQNWLATANTVHIVNYAALVLIVVDAVVVLYDLGAILKML